MDYRHYNHKKQYLKNSKCGKKQMEDRKSGIQPAETLAGYKINLPFKTDLNWCLKNVFLCGIL